MVEWNSLATAVGGVPPEAGKTVSLIEKSMWYVYVLKSEKNGRYYIGHTQNLDERLRMHNSGKTKSPKGYLPVNIIHTEVLETKQDAYKREMQIKSYKGGNAFKKIISNY